MKPLFHDRDGLIRHSFLLLAANYVPSMANMLFQMLVGRMLADKAEYGALATMLGIAVIASIPLEALRVAVAHFSAIMVQEGRREEIWGAVRRISLRFLVPAALFAACSLAFAGRFAAFFNLSSSLPVVLIGFVVAGSLFIPIMAGALQGIQAFVWMSIGIHSFAVIRLLAGAVIMCFLSATAVGGLAGHLLGIVFAIAIGFGGLRWVLGPSNRCAARVPGFRLYLIRSLFMLVFFAFLMNADILIIKHYFAGEMAGGYARVATIARIIVFMPMPVAVALFPKVVSEGGSDSGNSSLLFKAMSLTALIIAAVGAGCCVVPQIPLGILFKDWAPAPETVLMLRQVTCAMSPLGLVYLLVNYELAQKRFATAWVLGPCAAMYLLGGFLWHAQPGHVIAVLAGVSVSCLAGMAGVMALMRRSRACWR